MPDPIVKLITQGARQRGLDPAAVLAVAQQEGLSGRIGDGGHAFGPFQLNDAGGVITGRFAGQTPDQIQAWASSPEGIAYALDGIARVARGKQGNQAVQAIVSQFERPKDPRGEIVRALSALPAFQGGSAPKFGGAPGVPSPPAAPPAPGNNAAVLNLLAQGASMFGFDPAPLADLAAQAAVPARQTQAVKAARTAPAQIPTKHKTGSTIRFLEHFAEPFGLTVTSTTSGKHAKSSYHYKRRAVDFGGDSARLAALAAQALTHPQDFREMFYTGPGSPGLFIKDGVVYPNSQLDESIASGHKTHVHLAA